MRLLQWLANAVQNGNLEELILEPSTSFRQAIHATLVESVEGGAPAILGFPPIREIIRSNRRTLRTVRAYVRRFNGDGEAFLELDLGILENPVPGTIFQLQRFEHAGYFLNLDPPFEQGPHPWGQVLLRQEQLKELSINFQDNLLIDEDAPDEGPIFNAMHDFLILLIRQNMRTLTSLRVTCEGVGHAQEFRWDFQELLSRCHRLESLELFYTLFDETLPNLHATIPKFTGKDFNIIAKATPTSRISIIYIIVCVPSITYNLSL
jgi:hypothetical protein